MNTQVNVRLPKTLLKKAESYATGFKIKLFRIIFKDNNIEKREIHPIKKNQILLLTILERKYNYKDLKPILENYNLKVQEK